MNPLVLLSSDLVLMEQLIDAFHHNAPEIPIVLAGDPACLDAEVAACWYPPPGSLACLPNLKLIHSVAAGVDHIGSYSEQADIPICRISDPEQIKGMVEYVRWAALHYHRDFDRVLRQQHQYLWLRHPQKIAAYYQIGIMGLGAQGEAIATELTASGYCVRGWARTSKNIKGVNTFAGTEEFTNFLDGLDLLVNILPLTDATRGILCRRTFEHLAPEAAIVNCGRGQHLQEDDLIEAVVGGRLRGALLDVFYKEPLPLDNPLWSTPGITITPHMASAASHDRIVQQIAENIRRLHSREPLLNQVAPNLGY